MNPGIQLLELKVEEYKGKTFEIDFGKCFEQNQNMVLIGDNGAGKSSALEAILIIFGGFRTPSIYNKEPFCYSISYRIDNRLVEISSDKVNVRIRTTKEFGDGYVLFAEGELSNVRRRKNIEEILPRRIISFYAGENDRLNKINRTLLGAYRRGINGSNHKTAYEGINNRYIHFDNSIIPICLAMGMCDNYVREIIKARCEVDEIVNLEFYGTISKRISHTNPKALEEELMKELGRVIDGVYVTVRGESENKFYYQISFGVYRNTPERWFELWEIVNAKYDGTFRVKYLSRGVELYDEDMSQGQRQWLRVLGMLLISSVDSIVLMDEPDAFLNPRWKYKFNQVIDSVKENMPIGNLLIVSHDPLMINGLQKESVRVFRKDGKEIVVYEPEDDLVGLGIDGILSSDCYGLRTSYDYATSEKIERRLELYIKMINEAISEEEMSELRKLTLEIGSMPLSSSSIDFLYYDFVREYKKTEYYDKEYFSKEMLKEKREKVNSIISRLFEAEK